MASQRKNDNPGGNTGGNAQNGNRQGGTNTGRGRDDDDRADDRTGQRMAAQQDANRQADVGNTQDGEQVDQGSREDEAMGRQRQTDGGQRGSQFRDN